MAAWGTPILYYGNEVGMTGVVGVDGNFRKPMAWTSVPAAQADPDSNYNWQKTLDQIRLSRASLRRGSLTLPAAGTGTLAILRTLGAETTLVVANLTAATLPSTTVDLSGPALGTGFSTLVGAPSNTLAGTVLTLSQLPPLGVRIFALESGTLANQRGDFTDGAPTTLLQIAVKDTSSASLVASFYDGTGTKVGDAVPVYNGNGDYWWATMVYPIGITQGQVEVTRAAAGAQAAATTGRISFTISTPGTPQSLWPALNTGSAPAWYLRGISGEWDGKVTVPMAQVPGEPGHFVYTLSPAQAPASGVAFKINSSATLWDYFFGYWDVSYDTTKGGDDPGTVGWGYSDPSNYNMAFTPSGSNSYEIHFLNQPGFCKVWIKKVP
jgi:hypothetical protein